MIAFYAPNKDLSNLQQGYIFIGNNILPSLFAVSAFEQAQGLMYQEAPTPIMSFAYERPQMNRFWMSNTPAPLDILFVHRGKIAEICYGEPNSTRMLGNVMSDLVIELPAGSIESIGIRLGTDAGIVRI